MPVLTITKNWDDGTVLTESMLDDIKTSVETFLNTTKIDSDNIQSGGIATANYAASSVDATALASNAVTTAKINDGAVTAAKIATGVITQVKMGSVGQQISSSSGSYSTSSSSYTAVTNLSVSITTTGRPVKLMIQSDGSGEFDVRAQNSSNYADALLRFTKGGVELAQIALYANSTGTSSTTARASSLSYIDVPAAGTYTYAVEVKNRNSTTTFVNYAKLVAYEL